MRTVIILIVFASARSDFFETKIKREKLLENEIKLSIGENIVLSEEEQTLDKILMKLKNEELDYWFKNPKYYNFSKSFFEYKTDMKKSKVYKIIEKMPKGALLHVHANAILESDFFINITYRDNLFVCLDKVPKFLFSTLPPSNNCEHDWETLNYVRSTRNATKFDTDLRGNFTLDGTYHRDIDSVWKHFSHIFGVIRPILKYRPVWEEYLYKALKKLREDKIFYVEFRSALYELYEVDGTVHDPFHFVNLTKNVVDKFKRDFPDFIGAKIISSFGRIHDDLEKVLAIAKTAKEMFPDFIAGFDLNGREDLGGPLVDYLELLEAAKNDVGGYYFHAGETNWYGTYADENLIDAVVLGSKRIGHGVALLKHPLVLDEIEKSGTCVEMSVVSNNVLGLGEDMRLHPLLGLVARGIRVAISGDDPGLWGAPPISADFYVAFSSLSRRHGLVMLKKLALNSLHCSSMTEREKESAIELFSAHWNNFVSEFLVQYPTLN